jgi:hypothetical protein
VVHASLSSASDPASCASVPVPQVGPPPMPMSILVPDPLTKLIIPSIVGTKAATQCVPEGIIDRVHLDGGAGDGPLGRERRHDVKRIIRHSSRSLNHASSSPTLCFAASRELSLVVSPLLSLLLPASTLGSWTPDMNPDWNSTQGAPTAVLPRRSYPSRCQDPDLATLAADQPTTSQGFPFPFPGIQFNDPNI